MATTINNYNGTTLVTVDDGTLESASSSIRFPGRGYANYGEPVNENMLWITQNFARNVPPANPINGQAWYDTDNKVLKVYDSTTTSWIMAGSVFQGTVAPTISSSNNIPLWFHTTKKQLFSYDSSTTSWALIGPVGAADGSDPSYSVPTYTTMDTVLINDGATTHPVLRFVLGTTTTAIMSTDPEFTPTPLITGFSSIKPGINLNSTIANATITGDQFAFRSDQSNEPVADNVYDFGAAGARFANIYGVVFNGQATSAKYADLAERYESDKEYPAGTVVCIGGEKEITASTTPGDDGVFGVVSTNPAYLMNSDKPNETHPAIALVGRVPCKVVGQVKKGQRLMTSSVEGVACAWDPGFGHLAIIGRSLADKQSHGVDLLDIVVGKN